MKRPEFSYLNSTSRATLGDEKADLTSCGSNRYASKLHRSDGPNVRSAWPPWYLFYAIFMQDIPVVYCSSN